MGMVVKLIKSSINHKVEVLTMKQETRADHEWQTYQKVREIST